MGGEEGRRRYICCIVTMSLCLCSDVKNGKTEHVCVYFSCHIPEEAQSTVMQCGACQEWINKYGIRSNNPCLCVRGPVHPAV